MELNEPQLAAVNHVEGPILVLAGPGSGKTRVISERIKKLVEDGVDPEDIAAITFTRKAANEMKRRVRNTKIHISTFHSLCAKILRDDKQKFLIWGPEEQMDALRRIKPRAPRLYLERMASQISNVKGNHKTLDPRFKMDMKEYEEKLVKAKAKDFEDLVVDAYETVLEEKVEYKYLLVDEFQDTNKIQYDLVKALTKTTNNLFTVGDPNQSIYGWRGAHPQNVLDFVKDYPEAEIVELQDNYRSTQGILDTATDLVSSGTFKILTALKSHKGYGDRPAIKVVGDEYQEAEFIARKIQELLERDPDKKGKDIAVLCRTRWMMTPIREELKTQNIKGVNLTTIHDAKGLEFPVVFVPGVQQGLLPVNNAMDLEEERRLLYVAITRAMDEVYLSRWIGSWPRIYQPSVFLRDLDGLVDGWFEGDGIPDWYD